MREVRPGLRERVDRVPPRHGAEAETRDLREDEPHPVAALEARAKFRDRALVYAASVLRGDEPLQLVRVIIHCRSPQRGYSSSSTWTWSPACRARVSQGGQLATLARSRSRVELP